MTKEVQLPDTLAGRLAVAQSRMPQPAFDSENPHFHSRFASLSAVEECIIPYLNEVGIFLTQKPMFANGDFTIDTWVYYGDEAMCLGSYPVRGDTDQKVGGSLTYTRRYSLCAIFCRVADPDLDGEEPSKPKQLSFVAKCGSCGARYTFESKEQMLGTKCCEQPKWKVER